MSAFGRNLLYCNQGDGTFSEVSSFAHVDDPGYGASCTWADLNGDGLLDLYVVNYLEIDRDHYPICSRSVLGTGWPKDLVKVEGDTVTFSFEMRSGREHNTPDKAVEIGRAHV